DALTFDSPLSDRHRELAILRVALVTGSDYEYRKHRVMAVQNGVTADEVDAVGSWRDHASFTPADRAVLAATDDVLTDGTVSDATWAEVQNHLGDNPVLHLDLVTAIGAWRLLSEILRGLRVPHDEDTGLT